MKDIERYLSAHFAALYDQEVMAADRKVGDAETEYLQTNSVGKYLDLTVWGQMARVLDTSGTFAEVAADTEDAGIVTRKSALFRTFGDNAARVRA